MNVAAIAEVLPDLTHGERRHIMALLLQVEPDAPTLAEVDQLALERFQMLDAIENEDEH